MHPADGVAQTHALAPSIAGQMDSGEHQLLIPGLRKAAGLLLHPFNGHGAHRPAHAGNNAIGAVAVAALLNLHGGPGLALMAGHIQGLEFRFFKAVHRVDDPVFGHRALQSRTTWPRIWLPTTSLTPSSITL